LKRLTSTNFGVSGSVVNKSSPLNLRISEAKMVGATILKVTMKMYGVVQGGLAPKLKQKKSTPQRTLLTITGMIAVTMMTMEAT
jgi:hypothetical protein